MVLRFFSLLFLQKSYLVSTTWTLGGKRWHDTDEIINKVCKWKLQEWSSSKMAERKFRLGCLLWTRTYVSFLEETHRWGGEEEPRQQREHHFSGAWSHQRLHGPCLLPASPAHHHRRAAVFALELHHACGCRVWYCHRAHKAQAPDFQDKRRPRNSWWKP